MLLAGGGDHCQDHRCHRQRRGHRGRHEAAAAAAVVEL
jgi:hypothetical protein